MEMGSGSIRINDIGHAAAGRYQLVLCEKYEFLKSECKLSAFAFKVIRKGEVPINVSDVMSKRY